MSEIQIRNDDCLNVFNTIENASVDLIVTDPPYPVTARGSKGNTGGMLRKELTLRGKIFEHNDINVHQYAPEFYRVLKDGSHLYVMTNHVNLIEMLNTFTDVGFHFIKSLIWDKGNKIMGRFYMSQFEYILFFRKGTGKQINNCGCGVACKLTNRNFIGCEIDRKYFDIAKNRIEGSVLKYEVESPKRGLFD